MGEDVHGYNYKSSDANAPLRQMLNKILKEYATATKEPFGDHPLADYIRKSARDIFYDIGIVDKKIYKVKGSAGQSKWADVPWVAILDNRIDVKMQRGVYIAYLFSKDGSSFYLTLNQGFSEIDSNQNSNTGDFLKRNADYIIKNLNHDGFYPGDEIDLKSDGKRPKEYERGTIFYKEYKVDAVPYESELRNDLKKMLAIYQKYADRFDEFRAYEIQLINDMETIEDHTRATPASAPDQRMENDKTSTVKNTIDYIKSYIAAKGFSYEDGLIENFYLSLKAKPFVILAGTSGTGKSRLVRLFAEAVGALEAPDATDEGAKKGRFMMVPVRPDWSDSSDLFGHVNLNGEFIPGEIIGFIKRANMDIDKPYFLCLDEMNLARVEYYLSDILSVMETREIKKDQGRIVTDPLIKNDYYGGNKGAEGEYGEIYISENLYIIGTVNMDETTFPFSRKVLDRANTIEFSYVNLEPELAVNKNTTPKPLELPNSLFKAKYLLLSQCDCGSVVKEDYFSDLIKINDALSKAGAQIGYRVRDEIVFYMLYNEEYGIFNNKNDAFDYELMQKILPRISGNNSSIRDVLCGLFKICAKEKDNNYTSDGIVKTTDNDIEKNFKYKKSAKKIVYMMGRLEEDGFTSYWL